MGAAVEPSLEHRGRLLVRPLSTEDPLRKAANGCSQAPRLPWANPKTC